MAQMKLYNELSEVFKDIEYIQEKIDNLKLCQNSGGICNIMISFDTGISRKILTQHDTDISLLNEVRLLIQESIELYEQQILDLKLNF